MHKLIKVTLFIYFYPEFRVGHNFYRIKQLNNNQLDCPTQGNFALSISPANMAIRLFTDDDSANLQKSLYY